MFKYNRFNKGRLFECLKNATVKNGTIIIPADYDIELNLTCVPNFEQSDLMTYSDIVI